jgi:hypothetical protein
MGAKFFIAIWLAGAFINMWIGVKHGYSWSEEFPIFLGIFAVPAAVALLVSWRVA